MFKVLLKSIVALIISSLFFSLVYASNHIVYQSAPQRYILRITSQDPAVPISFTASYMTSSNLGSKITRLDKVTPFEVEEKTNALDFMIMATNNAELLKVEVLDKDQSGEHPRLSGTGGSNYGLISTDGIAIIGS